MSTAAGATRRAVAVPDEPGMEQPAPQPVPEPVFQVEDVVERAPDPEPQPEPAMENEAEYPELGPDDPIWDGGPLMRNVTEWKNQHGDGNIYVTSVTPTVNVVWRTLTRFEYRRLVKNMEQAVAAGTVSQAEANLNNEEQICELCMLYPSFTRQQMAGELAGLPSLISQEVMQASGFEALEIRQL